MTSNTGQSSIFTLRCLFLKQTKVPKTRPQNNSFVAAMLILKKAYCPLLLALAMHIFLPTVFFSP